VRHRATPLLAATPPPRAPSLSALEAKILASGLSVSDFVATAWASAASFRGSDKRGGANGARVRLSPQKDWAVNQPAKLATVIAKLEEIQKDFNGAQSGGKRVSLADLIVLGGTAAVEKAAKDGGSDVTVPFTPGRVDARQDKTDVESFSVMEPEADGFRNYLKAVYSVSAEAMLVDRAQLLTLSAPDMTVLVGGLRALDANTVASQHGVFTNLPASSPTTSSLTSSTWSRIGKPPRKPRMSSSEAIARRASRKWTGTRVNLDRLPCRRSLIRSSIGYRRMYSEDASFRSRVIFAEDTLRPQM
jgi:catalase-peroxidase